MYILLLRLAIFLSYVLILLLLILKYRMHLFWPPVFPKISSYFFLSDNSELFVIWMFSRMIVRQDFSSSKLLKWFLAYFEMTKVTQVLQRMPSAHLEKQCATILTPFHLDQQISVLCILFYAYCMLDFLIYLNNLVVHHSTHRTLCDGAFWNILPF